MAHRESLKLQTSGHGHMMDLTQSVQEIIARSGVEVGLANVFVIGSTAAIGAIEFEPGLQRDLPEMLDRLIPPSFSYGHEQTWHDGNGLRISKRPYLGSRLPCQSVTRNRCWAPGSRSFCWNVILVRAREKSLSRS